MALAILGIMCSSVMVVMSRNMDAAYNMRLKVQATEIVRENIEKFLIAPSVNEQTDYGISEQHPEIRWETTVESFSPPLGANDWIRALCRAEYEDARGQTRTVELVHWLTELTDTQSEALDEMNQADAHVLASINEAADYAGVEREVIELWIDGGLKQTESGEFISSNLDLFIRTEGMPSQQELDGQLDALPEIDETEDVSDPALTNEPDKSREGGSEVSRPQPTTRTRR